MSKGQTHGELIAAGLRDKYDFRGLMPETYDCVDCGVNTAPGNPTRAEAEELVQRDGQFNNFYGPETEVYLVHKHVWEKAGLGPDGGCLCISCLEKRIGRRLTPDDFVQDHAFFGMPGSKRMLERQGLYEHPDFEIPEDLPPPTELERALDLVGTSLREARLP